MSSSVKPHLSEQEGAPPMKAHADSVVSHNLISLCERVSGLAETFYQLGAQRDLTCDEASMELGQQQIEIYDELRDALVLLSAMSASNPLEVANVARVIADLRDRFGFCGFGEEMLGLVQAHENDATRLVPGEVERTGGSWFQRRIFGFLGRNDYQTRH